MKKLTLAAAMLAAAPAAAQITTPAPVVPSPTSAAPAPTVPPPTTPRPATNAGEVAAIVAREFPAYDKDASGGLSPDEFGGWMVRLKAIADPAATADAPSTKTWLGAAFAQADLDKSQSVTLAELTGFLSPSAS
ncbi:EF-hand domain-containing protein [uncultured Sphingomonas sp.]|uniref:EF-hand domain-containing protein n=1 Tax=uncultured Sphingomonas sp. TaxID=158754 RepID=UPI0035CBFCB1